MFPILVATLFAPGCTAEDPSTFGGISARDTEAAAGTEELTDTAPVGVDTGTGGGGPGTAAGSDTGGTEGSGSGGSGPDTAPEGEPSLLQFVGEPPRNVLMISIDTLRRDHIGRYAGDPTLSPNIDRLLEEGVVLDDHRSCSDWTLASSICVLAGQDPLALGSFPEAANPADSEVLPVNAGAPMISVELAAAGYSTSLISSNPYLSSYFNFDLFYQETQLENEADADVISAAGLEELEALKAGGGPWMLHLHYFEPHAAYDPPEDYLNGPPTVLGYDARTHDSLRELDLAYELMGSAERAVVEAYVQRMYTGEVRYLDDQLALLLETLDAAGDLDDTLVVLWSDHGEQLWQRGVLEHGAQLHSEESDALAAFWAKNIIPATADYQTGHIDIAPTLLDALGVPIPESYSGRVLMSELEEVPRFSTVLRWENTSQSVDIDRRRLIYTWDGSLEYYLMDEDPRELNNLIDPADEDVLELWRYLKPEIIRMADYYTDYEALPSILDGEGGTPGSP